MEPMGNMTTTHVAAVLDVRTSTLSPHSLSLSSLSAISCIHTHAEAGPAQVGRNPDF